jgi:hypothetical protein
MERYDFTRLNRSNEPGASCFIGTLNASPVVNSAGETGATYTCAARVPRNRDTYTTTEREHFSLNFQEHRIILDNTININYTLFGRNYPEVFF